MSARRNRQGAGTTPHLDQLSVADPRTDELERENAQLREAVGSQRTIGTALGLVAMRYQCTSEQSWQLLQRLSQQTNTKVRVVARVLVAAHDGGADVEDEAVLAVLLPHLPMSGWVREDLVP